jgi:hypothetical protein
MRDFLRQSPKLIKPSGSPSSIDPLIGWLPETKIETTGLERKTVLRLYYAHEERPDTQQDGPIIALDGQQNARLALP